MGNKTSARRGHATEESSSPMFTFFAIGDFGVPNELIKQTARAMDGWAKEHGAPNIILGLGDNFYPCGVGSADDENFCTCWSDIFLIYETLRVPWKMVLGNHDYMWEPQAQIDFHYNKALNKGGLWNMPATCYRFSESVSHTAIVETAVDSSSSQPVETSTVPATPDTAGDFKIDFFAIDTNACQYHVARVFPDLVDTLLGFVDQLHTSLVGSNADWKIVFGHHPMYTQGKGHGEVGQCLRADYHPKERPKRPDYDGVRMPKGFGLEKALSTGGVHAYFSAHEHVFQVQKGCTVCSVCAVPNTDQLLQRVLRTFLFYFCTSLLFCDVIYCSTTSARVCTASYAGHRVPNSVPGQVCTEGWTKLTRWTGYDAY